MADIRLPRLLNADLTERARLTPIRLSVDGQLLKPSTAEMTLAPDDAPVALRDLVELYDQHGSLGVYRVTAIDTGSESRILHLAHGVTTLGDGLITLMEHADTVASCLQRLLSWQGDIRWAMGGCDVPSSRKILFSAENENVLDALYRFLMLLPSQYAFFFDQSGPVWYVHLRELDERDPCEGRVTRNLEDLVITRDASRLCTRVYPYGGLLDQQRVTVQPVLGRTYLDSAAASEWGLISGTFTEPDVLAADTLRDVAQRYLALHATPETTVDIRALDLSDITGETLDDFRLGRLCRLALPDWNTTLNSRITRIRREDIFGDPLRMRVTLADHLRTGAAELDNLKEQVIGDKLESGDLTSKVSTNRAEGTVNSPIVHYFTVENGSMVLSVLFGFTPDTGVSIRDLRIDDTYVPENYWRTSPFDGTAFLKRSSIGHPVNGRHHFAVYPSTGTYGEMAAVNTTVTQKVIE